MSSSSSATEAPPTYAPRPRLTPPDFETASIRSAAPSYTSAAPTYQSTLDSAASSSLPLTRRSSAPPELSDFRIPTWSTTRSNPTARHYHSVAHRRATVASAREEQKIRAAAMTPNPVAAMLHTLEEEEAERYRDRERPLEDEALVGKEAAEKAKKERMGWGKEVLLREDRRWDWLLDQMKDWEEREKSWKQFSVEVEQGKRGKLARRLGFKK